MGADLVTQELDLFNLKYQRLCEALRDRLQEVGDGAEDSNIKVVTYPHISMQQAKRKISSYIRTYEIKFNIQLFEKNSHTEHRNLFCMKTNAHIWTILLYVQNAEKNSIFVC